MPAVCAVIWSASRTVWIASSQKASFASREVGAELASVLAEMSLADAVLAGSGSAEQAARAEAAKKLAPRALALAMAVRGLKERERAVIVCVIPVRPRNGARRLIYEPAVSRAVVHACTCIVMRMSIKVAVAGASGYVGGEVLRVFSAHPDVVFGALTAHASVGDSIGQHHPHLMGLAERIITETTAENLAGHDVVVLALPHGTSAQVAAQLDPDTLVIDCGADFRLASARDWAEYYGGEYAGQWAYGIPELMIAGGLAASNVHGKQRQALAGVTRIAAPGCNASAVTLAVQPGVAAGVIDASDIVATLAVGYSGAGKKLATNLLASEALGSAVPYAVGGTHRHVPEIAQNLRLAGATKVGLSFTPILVPMSRGILASVTAPLVPGTSSAQVREAWLGAYKDEPFVHMLPEGQWPVSGATTGANTALIQVAVDAKAGRVIAVCALDNLVKGTAGAALQSMNIALGLDETTGLSVMGVAP